MRPIDKGASSLTFSDWREARDPLIAAIGDYCCYCERPCDPEVEHEEPKANPKYRQGILDWANFLLACGDCNRQKTDKDPRIVPHYFPDEVNTASTFFYDEVSNEVVSMFDIGASPQEHEASVNTIALTNLNRRLDSMRRPDRRWRKREDAWKCANRARQRHPNPTNEKDVEAICDLAKATGFFSVWMTVFTGDTVVRQALITSFEGTRRRCFDNQGQAIPDLSL